MEYSAFPRMLSASLAWNCAVAPPCAGVLQVISGGVLSIRNGSLSRDPVRTSCGGFEGASEALTRRTYLPSGYAVESQLRYRWRTLSRRGFQAVSLTPRISILN